MHKEKTEKSYSNITVFYVLFIMGVISIISAIINMLIYLDDTVVLVSKPFVALGIALIIIAYFYKPKKEVPKKPE